MNDAQIVGLYLQRDEIAVAQTAARYGARLRALACGILGDPAAAEECENDVYLAAWRSIPPNEPRDHFFAYLARIARHLAIDRLRAQGRDKRVPAALTVELSECVAGAASAEDRLNARELAACVSAFLRGLPRQKRWLFLRRYWYCDSIADLARTLGWGESRVKTALHRLRSALREQLRKEGFLE